jgi:hypothetical protein
MNIILKANMTPMQQTKPLFDTFKKLIPKTFKQLTLNKSSIREFTTSFCGEPTTQVNRGVKSDFVKTFTLKQNAKDCFSIGFTFMYIGLLGDDRTVQLSLKVGTDNPTMYIGNEMTVAQFKVWFTELNSGITPELDSRAFIALVKNRINPTKTLPSWDRH